MAWTNNFEVDDMPWLRDYQVGPWVTFPLAGYICAALEASKQCAMVRNADSDGKAMAFAVREVQVLHKLVFEEGLRVELVSKLRPQRGSDLNGFELSTWNEEKQSWTHHCRALIECRMGPDQVFDGYGEEDMWKQGRAECRNPVGSPLLYQGSAKTRPRRTGTFRNVQDFWYGVGKAAAEVVVQETEAVMPQGWETEYVIHLRLSITIYR